MNNTYEEYLKEKLKNPEFVREYIAEDPEFDLGIMLYKARKEKGLSQKEVSEMTGINQGNLSKIETGERTPTIRTMQKIAACLGMTVALVPLTRQNGSRPQ